MATGSASRKTLNAIGWTVALVLTAAAALNLTPALPANVAGLGGLWQCRLTRLGGDMPFVLDLKLSGDTVAGRVWSPEGHLNIAVSTLQGGLLTLQLPSPNGTYVLTANYTGQALIDGLVTLDGKSSGNWRGERTPLPGTKTGIESLSDGRIRSASPGGLREAYLPISFPSSHAANLIGLRNGDLLCAYYAGFWEGESNVAIAISRLTKGSDQWTAPVAVASKPRFAFENPVLFEPAEGELRLFHTAQPAHAGQASSQIFLMTSSNAGKDWSRPRLLFAQPGSFDRQPLLVSGQTWIFPIYYTPSGAGGDDALQNYSAIEVSTNRGATWQQCTVPGSQGLVQPDVVELSPGHFQAFFRSRWADWVYVSSSTGACNWSDPVATRIPNNNSSIQVIRLNNGHLVIAFNNSQAATKRGKSADAPRWPLSVALSTDGGRTWPWVRDAETGSEVPVTSMPATIAGADVTAEEDSFFDHLYSYEYPSILQTADGVLHMAYTFRRRTIKYLAFDEAWIKGGRTTGTFRGDHAE